MESFQNWWSKASLAALTHWVWVVAIISVTLLCVSPLIAHEEARKIIQTIASVVLASGVAGAVIRSSTFTEMFIARIVDVFYDGKHLRSRNDLSQICTRTLNALLEAESPILRGAVGSELLSGYLDFKLGYVYRDFSSKIQVEKVDKINGTICVLETTTATIIPNLGKSELDFVWSWKSTTNSRACAELVFISVDGSTIPIENLVVENEDQLVRVTYKHRVQAFARTPEEVNQIELVRRVRKTVDLRRDPVTKYRFTAPCLGMSIELLDFPEDALECEVAALGMPRDFRPDRKAEEGHGQWRSQRFSGLIFPRQGAILQWYLK